MIVLLTSLLCSAKIFASKDIPYLLRNRKIGKQDWYLDSATIVEKENGITATIDDNTYNEKLMLSIELIDCGKSTFHVQIKPQKAESFNRFDCSKEEAIVEQGVVNSKRKCAITKSNESVKLNNELEVTFKPFAIKVFDEKGEAAIVNFDDAAVFEQNRDKAKYPDLFKPVIFREFTDPIKNGPTSVAMSFRFNGENIRLSGLPSHTLTLSLPDTNERDPIRFFNTDMNHYGLDETMSMYGCIPFIFGHSETRYHGLFWANSSETWVDITNKEDKKECDARFVSEGGYIDFYMFTENKPKDIPYNFTNLTGKPIFLPRFALAYHQCKWGYHDQEMFEKATHSLDEYGVPHDVMWADIDHTEDKKYFAFNPKTYPHPEKFIEEFDKVGRKLVAIVDPHIKVEKGYKLYEEAHERGLAIKAADGKTDFEGECWPGNSIWADFMNPETSEWWASKYSFDHFKQSAENVYIWNDMNEISVFKGPEGSCPRNIVHHGDYENREVHNIYGLLMTRATNEGLRQRTLKAETRKVSGKPMRPFVLTRSWFAGNQKYAGCWSGDNQSTFGYLKESLQLLLSYGICGMIFTGCDVGGFFNDPSDKLLSRWHQAGAWLYPFFRNHAIIDMPQREIPLMKDEKLKELARESVIERYRILPYWYTVYRDSCTEGQPIVRPLWLEFNDKEFVDVQEYAMIGSSLLVVPFLDEEEKGISFVLPKGHKWYNYRTLQEHKNGFAEYNDGRTLVLIKDGSIIPKKSETKPVEKTTQLMNKYPIELVVVLDDNKEATGRYYDDDGLSDDHMKGDYLYTEYVFKDGKLSCKLLNKENDYAKQCGDIFVDTIKIVNLGKEPSKILIAGKEVSFTYNENVLIIKENIRINEEWEISIQ
jgi:alpha 1,3-glucosidase